MVLMKRWASITRFNRVKVTGRKRRHIRIRKKVIGTKQRPRLFIYRGSNNMFAHFVDDIEGKTLFSCSTLSKDIKGKIKSGSNIKAAEALGQLAANMAKQKKIESVIFDRGGCLYHGRVKAFAETARKGGLKF